MTRSALAERAFIDGAKVRVHMERLGWKPDRLAVEVDLAGSTVWKILGGHNRGDLDTVVRFARIFGCSVEDLLG